MFVELWNKNHKGNYIAFGIAFGQLKDILAKDDYDLTLTRFYFGEAELQEAPRVTRCND